MELRLPAPLRSGVDGDVRPVTPADELTEDSTVVVVGASLAGWRSVETLRTEGFEGTISLVGDERHLPYDRPPLSKQVLAGTWPPEKAVLADKRRSSELRVHEVLGRRAVRLDAEGRKVELDDGTVLDGDAIVVATGASPRRFPGTVELGQSDGLFTLRTLDDSIALRAAVTAVESPRVVIIGAGFIGAEVASTCVGLGARVTVLEAMDIPLRNVLGPMIGAHCGSLHGANGVELRTGVAVAGIRKDSTEVDAGAGTGARARSGLVIDLAEGERLPADLVVVGIGVEPSTDWLTDSGLTLENGVVCDDRLFAADGIVSAGDIARWNWRHDGVEELIRIEHWQVAAEAGVAAARSLVAGHPEAPSFVPIPYFWSDQYGIRFQVLGNPRGDDEVEITEGSLEEGKFVALFGREGRLRAVMAIGKPRQLMGFRPLLHDGCSWDDALAHGRS
jgi:3-phenylpropionate/trans-cinnamate dioxygenase ferredoxin reductase component